MKDSEIRLVFGNFNASGTWLGAGPTGSGHIHATYLVNVREKDHPGYILQRINDTVFPPVDKMMGNIEKVIAHLRGKKQDNDGRDVLEIIKTREDKSYYTDSHGSHWRMYRKISPGISYDIVPNEKVAGEAGKAFGRFISDLGDMPAGEIFPVIPGFHSVELRFDQFNEALSADPLRRAGGLHKEIEFANGQINNMRIIPGLINKGELPVRITHNDTKLNNVLFDNNDNAVCVIDLDTVMPGLSLYDFGDTIRTAANPGKEDEADLGKIVFDLQVFKAYAKGFLAETTGFLNRAETDNLALSCQYMTFIMGLRFLTDYIKGDIYYATSYPEQNLRRCRAQFRLMQSMIEKYPETLNLIAVLENNRQI
jgi:hypothetical protein